MSNDDENKTFGVTFRTPPKDATGVAHILEHSVLCGSRKYPVKDPFAELAKSSLSTFLNAMTFPDKTTYPAASANLKDFYNLLDVYLSFIPGWRARRSSNKVGTTKSKRSRARLITRVSCSMR
jgi:Zn-dependent M16 (insulinase) family peptidase